MKFSFPREWTYVMILFFGACSTVSHTRCASPGSPKPRLDLHGIVPNTEKKCNQVGGVWDVISPEHETKVCRVPSTDFGCSCMQDSQCQGLCNKSKCTEKIAIY